MLPNMMIISGEQQRVEASSMTRAEGSRIAEQRADHPGQPRAEQVSSGLHPACRPDSQIILLLYGMALIFSYNLLHLTIVCLTNLIKNKTKTTTKSDFVLFFSRSILFVFLC